MNLVGDPVAIRNLAATMRRNAEHLDVVGRRVAQRSADCSWSAPRADRFRARLSADRRKAADLAGRLVDIANQLDRTAASVEAELRALHGLERAVRLVINEFRPVAGAVAPWLGTGWNPQHLPAPGDPAWRTCARAFGIR